MLCEEGRLSWAKSEGWRMSTTTVWGRRGCRLLSGLAAASVATKWVNVVMAANTS